MTFDYQESTAILGPLSTKADPVGYDLCKKHSERLSAPRGWQVVRLADSFTVAAPNDEELMALANAVRAASQSDKPRQSLHPASRLGSAPRQMGENHGGETNPENYAAGKPSDFRYRHLSLVDDPPQRVS